MYLLYFVFDFQQNEWRISISLTLKVKTEVIPLIIFMIDFSSCLRFHSNVNHTILFLLLLILYVDISLFDN